LAPRRQFGRREFSALGKLISPSPDAQTERPLSEGRSFLTSRACAQKVRHSPLCQ
jgi:hypothetical protein